MYFKVLYHCIIKVADEPPAHCGCESGAHGCTGGQPSPPCILYLVFLFLTQSGVSMRNGTTEMAHWYLTSLTTLQGSAKLALWPNALLSRGSTWFFKEKRLIESAISFEHIDLVHHNITTNTNLVK